MSDTQTKVYADLLNHLRQLHNPDRPWQPEVKQQIMQVAEQAVADTEALLAPPTDNSGIHDQQCPAHHTTNGPCECGANIPVAGTPGRTWKRNDNGTWQPHGKQPGPPEGTDDG